MNYRIRYWTGPTRVVDYVGLVAKAMPEAHDIFGGTEHVYFLVEAKDEIDARVQVWAALGKSFTRVSSFECAS